MSPRPNFARACAPAFLVALVALPGAARAQTNIALDNLTATTETSKFAIRHVDFIGANITPDEARKLLTDATREEAATILGKLEAKQIVIPEATVGPSDGSGAVVLRNLQVDDVSKGVAARLSLASFEGDGKDKSGGRVTVKGGAMTFDKLDAAAMIAALKSGGSLEGLLKASRMTSNGVEITAPDKDTPADAPGGNAIRLGMASFAADQTYEGDAPARTTMTVNGLTVQLPKASKAGAALAAEGYERIETNWRFGGLYDPAQRVYSLEEFSVDAPGVGALRLRGKFADLDRSMFSGPVETRAAALAGGAISEIELRVANAGVFEKIVAYAAKDKNKTPAQLVAEWKAVTGALLPALAGGDPVGAAAAQAVGRFLDNPKSLTIAIKGKSGPVKVAELFTMSNPMAILQKADVAFFTEGGQASGAPAAKPAAPAPVAQAPSSQAPAPQAPAPQAPAKLTGIAAWSALVGNTVAGKDSDGDDLYEFYKPDGTLKQLNDETVTSGKWALKGQKVCIVYSGEDDETCYQVEVFGDAATFTDDDGDGQRYKILKGNPKGL